MNNWLTWKEPWRGLAVYCDFIKYCSSNSSLFSSRKPPRHTYPPPYLPVPLSKARCSNIYVFILMYLLFVLDTVTTSCMVGASSSCVSDHVARVLWAPIINTANVDSLKVNMLLFIHSYISFLRTPSEMMINWLTSKQPPRLFAVYYDFIKYCSSNCSIFFSATP